MYLFNFQANVTSSVIQCYTDLVKQITVAIHHEEERCQYLSSQAKIMLAIHDEVAAMPEGEGTCHFWGTEIYLFDHPLLSSLTTQMITSN